MNLINNNNIMNDYIDKFYSQNFISIKTIIVYLLIINLIGFLSMFIDKKKAKWGSWRIPENTLFLYAILGGTIGSLIGMYVFRHKTKKPKFKFGMPMLLILQIIAVIAFSI